MEMELKSRRHTVSDLGGAMELCYTNGWTDGLPVVPPTAERIRAMLYAAGIEPRHQIAFIENRQVSVTAEKVAINAVMAGCKAEYMPVIVAAVEALADPLYGYHGPATSTGGSAVFMVVNGPIVRELDINCGDNLFGPGWRANATIGRALRLVCVNVGGATPGGVSMSTLAHPGRYSYCIGEREEESPWESLAVEHGFASGDSTVAVLAADAPLGVYDQRSRTPVDLLATIAASLAVVSHHKMTHWGDTLLVISPEHAKILGDAGWKKPAVQRWLWDRLRRPVSELVPGRNGGDGLPEHVLAKFKDPEREPTLIPKFRAPENIKLVVAGGTAGRFSAIVPGWTFAKSSSLVFRPIRTP